MDIFLDRPLLYRQYYVDYLKNGVIQITCELVGNNDHNTNYDIPE